MATRARAAPHRNGTASLFWYTTRYDAIFPFVHANIMYASTSVTIGRSLSNIATLSVCWISSTTTLSHASTTADGSSATVATSATPTFEFTTKLEYACATFLQTTGSARVTNALLWW